MSKRKPPKDSMLTHEERVAINEALMAAGYDGNKRFRSASHAISEAVSVLAKFGIEPDQVISAYEFKRQSGDATIYLAFSNERDPYSPIAIENAMLFYQWYEHPTGTFEALAYVS